MQKTPKIIDKKFWNRLNAKGIGVTTPLVAEKIPLQGLCEQALNVSPSKKSITTFMFRNKNYWGY